MKQRRIFRDIPTLPEYQACSDGFIWKISNSHGFIRARCKMHGDADDYQHISIRGEHFKVHRLVCLAFHGEPVGEKAQTCNHKDGNKANNRPENLEWATSKENADHTVITLGYHNLLAYAGKKHPLTCKMYVRILRLLEDGVSREEIYRRLRLPFGFGYMGTIRTRTFFETPTAIACFGERRGEMLCRRNLAFASFRCPFFGYYDVGDELPGPDDDEEIAEALTRVHRKRKRRFGRHV